jgi:hypothetical protein
LVVSGLDASRRKGSGEHFKVQKAKFKWQMERRNRTHEAGQIKKQRPKVKNAPATQPELPTPGQLTTDNGQLTTRLARKLRIFAANGEEEVRSQESALPPAKPD